MTPDDLDALAGEYVLGTLPDGERAEAAARVVSDPAFAAAVAGWRRRLAPLDAVVRPVAPPAALWSRIETAVAAPAPDEVRIDPPARADAAPLGYGDTPHVDAGGRLADAAGPIADVIDLSRRLRFWRAATGTAAALAAGLAAVVVLDRLPAPPAGDAGRFVAVVNRDGAVPALIVEVDTAAGLVTVRSLTAERPADRSLELWAIPEGGTPVSLGLIDPAGGRQEIRPARAGVLPTRGAFAVSVEPPGGSTTGAPTGPVVYQGPLVPLAD